ncbi:glycosyltransferase [Arenimonas composti]|uniref:glycosyltransferase n=1 Tax=Arenimonas composti TaxID=370776 RepID=UPI00137709DC|nr:glycosyltransferase [Arenimonas composti]
MTTSYPRAGDGSEAAGGFVADLAAELALHGPVRVVAPGDNARTEAHGALQVFRYPAPTRPLSTLRPWRPAEARDIWRVLRDGAAVTRRAVAAAGPTAHVLALWALPSGDWARRAALDARIGYSVWTLGSDIWSLARLPGVRARLKKVLAEASRCYSDGLQLAEDTRSIAGRPVEFLPSTRRTEAQRDIPPRDEPPYRLLFLGRWHRNKGVDLLIDALRQLDDDTWRRIELVDICGGGPLQECVADGVAALAAAGRPVRMRGFLAKPDAEAAMLAADWLLIPSRIESIPVVFSDAVKLGLPIVTTPVGDLPGLTAQPPACGRVATAVEPAAFAAEIAAAVRAGTAAYVAGTRDRAGRFDLSRIASRIREVPGD